MEKPVAVLEISSSSIKLLIGYELNGKPQVLYSLTKPFNLIVDSGTFLDPNTIRDTIREFSSIKDSSAKLNISISEVVLILPPYGLEVFQTQQVTAVVGDDSKIGSIDIRNIYSLIRKGKIPATNNLIDIIPDNFTLDQGVTYQVPPIGESSTSLAIRAKVHTLPSYIDSQYQNIVKEAGINVKRTIVAPCAASELFATYPEIPSEYLLVDIGSHITTVSLIGGKQLYASRFIQWGGHKITSKIGEAFNINETEAEKYKILCGIDKRKTSYKIPICKSTTAEGVEKRYYADELTSIIKGELESFASQLNGAINNLLSSYDSSIKSIPMILTGGGSLLNGLCEYLEPKVKSDYVKVASIKTLGARNPSFVNCLGAVIVNSKYQTVFDDMHPKIGQITRNPK